MIPKTDIEKLLELYKLQGNQVDDILDLVRSMSNTSKRTDKNMDRIIGILEVLTEDIINLNARVMELEKGVKHD